MRLARVLVWVVLAAGAFPAQAGQGRRIALPPGGRLYHGVFPGGLSGDEDDVTTGQVGSYEGLVGQQVAWVYFSHNWFRGRRFPVDTATWIRGRGSVPFIRLMLRSEADMDVREPLYTLQRILDGDFDADLRRWARDASDFGTAVVVEYGTECNGNWFQWNAQWHGKRNKTGFGDPDAFDGAERFVAAYRHIVQTMRAEGADNVTWCFHVNNEDYPERNWNRMELYYPGDDVVDWLGVSCYGAETPIDDWPPEAFRWQLDQAYPRLRAIAPAKPIMVMELGCTAGRAGVEPGAWAQAALTDLFAGRWPAVRGFNWWNEAWENDDDPAHDTTMRVEDVPALATAFNDTLGANAAKLQTRPVFEDDGGEPPGGPPVADAGPDQTVRLGDTVTLDGTGSHHPDDAVNVALAAHGATVTGTNGAAWAALIDGNTTHYTGSTGYGYTYWRPSPPGSMTVALAAAHRLARIRVKLWDGNARYYQYTVDVAEGASGPWQRVVDRGSGAHRGWCEDAFPPVQARYLRITGTYNSANNGFHVVELEAYAARPLAYAWSQSGGPDVSLSDPTAVAPTFAPPEAGQYEFALVVSDGAQASAADTVAITVEPAPLPVADAGPDQAVRLGETVALDGSGSYHPDDQAANVALAANGAAVAGTNGANWAALIDGNSTQYTGATGFAYTYWTTSPPGSMTVRLSQAGWLGRIRVKLWDGDSRSYRYAVDAAESAAGPWHRVVDRTSGAQRGWCEDTFPAVQARHLRITGTYNSANAGFHAVELEAYAARPLAYAWSQTGGPDVSLSDPTAAAPTFAPPEAGQYTFALTVSDGAQSSAADHVAIAVGTAPPPVADAGPDQTLRLGQTVALDGSGSYHPDDRATNVALAANGATVTGTNGAAWAALIDGNATQYTSATGYAYTYWRTTPPGSMTVALAGAHRLGRVRVKLWDGDARFYRYAVDVAESAGGPWQRVADRTSGVHRGWCEDTFAAIQATHVRITGTHNSANHGFHVVELEAYAARPLAYAWSQTAGPGVSLSDPTAAAPTLTPPAAGQYELALVVSDGAQASAADTVAVTVAAAPPPVAHAGPDQTVAAGQAVTLDGTGSYHPDDLDLGNVALAANGATAAGTNGGNWAALIDGNATQYTGGSGYAYTYWTTSPPGSMTVQLPQARWLGRLRVKLWDGDSRSYRYTVDLAPSAAGPWERVVDRASGAHRGWCEDTFAAVQARYIRITGTHNSANAGFHVVELEAYEARPLTYAWTQATGAAVALSDPAAPRPTLTPTEPGEYEFDLVVSDAAQSSSADRVKIGVTHGPAPARPDGAQRLEIPLAGSLQNPAFSPDGRTILFTRFRNGYNQGPADLYLFNLDTGVVQPLVADGHANVNLPGAAWHPATNRIAFASDRDPHDEIFIIPATGHTGDETRVTSQATRQSYEPTFSPDGQWLVFESHPLDVAGQGVVTRHRADGTGAYVALTAAGDDCRQPNWDPAGAYVVYQKLAGGQWDLWLTDPDGATHRKLTTGAGDKTDGSFSPSGRWVVYSSDEGGLAHANLFARPAEGGDARRITQYTGYDGAPSWSPDGTRVAFESTPGDPDGSAGSTLWIIAASEDLAPPLSAVQFWAYQIQNVEAPGAVDALAASRYDLLVIEPTRTDWSSVEARTFDTAAAVARLKATHGHDGTRRKLVLAYVDIGEAEDWRWYWTWSTTWQPGRPKPADWPDYILAHDPDGWEGNYPVAYWDPAWKDLMIYGLNYPPTSSRDFTSVLDEVLRDGFDGIYLDWVEAWEDASVRQAAAADGVDSAQEMIDFIAEIRTYARQRDPNFLVVQQNAAELLDGRPQLLAHVDAIAQEAIWYDGVGGNDDWSDPDGYDDRNDADLTDYYIEWLDRYKAAGLPVFNCEYARARAATAYANSLNKGYIPYCTRRSLGALTTTPPPGY